MKPIIQSLMDTDLYKFTMMQCVLHQFPSAGVSYQFKCRTDGVNLAQYKNEIQEEINHLCQLRFTEEELEYMRTLDYISCDFVQFLRLFQLNADFVTLSAQDNELHIEIEGPWLHTIMFEVPLLAIISEVYLRNTHPDMSWSDGQQRLADKIQTIQTSGKTGFIFSDFGTRRRFSRVWQEQVVRTLQKEVPDFFGGTSNVDLARRLGLVPIGTMAHEFFQACQALGPRLVDSQKFALDTWTNEFRGRLGIALTDVVGMDAFLRDFDLYFAKLFDGLRHDSGDPVVWCNKAIEHYRKMKIDPKSKSMVFSDALNIDRAMHLYDLFQEETNPVFGIGTNITNDMGVEPLNIVIKMTRCNDQPVAKISDSPGKAVCEDPSYLSYMSKVFQVDQD